MENQPDEVSRLFAVIESGLPASGSSWIPEPSVKELLQAAGVAVPRGAMCATVEAVAARARELAPPLVVKAVAPSLVHKSDVGGVETGIADPDAAVEAAHEIAKRVGQQQELDGWLVEEQASGDVEIIVGYRVDHHFGPTMMVGLGGVLAETYGDVTFGFPPVDEDLALSLLQGLRGRALFDGFRGRPKIDYDVIARTIASIGRMAARLGDGVRVLECNPLIVGERACVAVDARMAVERPAANRRRPVPGQEPAPSTRTSVWGRLFEPRTVAVVGASETRSVPGNEYLRRFRGFGFSGDLYAIHPTATEIDGCRCYPSLAEVPGVIDYAVISVPAGQVRNVLANAGRKVAFAHILTSGFGEVSESGRREEEALLQVAREQGTRLIGPNCLGVYSPAGHLTFIPDPPAREGNVGVISQSGGLAGDIIRMGASRGIAFTSVTSIGNAIDLGAAELVDYLVADERTEVVGLYLETSLRASSLYEALSRARGTKPVVILKGGRGDQGARVAASHTGALSSDGRLWQALASQVGATLVETFEELVEVLAFFSCHALRKVSADEGVLVFGPGGGTSVLATDAFEDAGLTVTRLPDDVRAELEDLGIGAGVSFANPVDVPLWSLIRQTSRGDVAKAVIEGVLSRLPMSDVVVHLNIPNFFQAEKTGGVGAYWRLVDSACEMQQRYPGTRFAIVLRGGYADDRSAELERGGKERAGAAGVPVYERMDQAANAVAAGKRYSRAVGERRRASPAVDD